MMVVAQIERVGNLVVHKGEHWYIFHFEMRRRRELLPIFGRWAADPELNLAWADVAAVCARLGLGPGKGLP